MDIHGSARSSCPRAVREPAHAREFDHNSNEFQVALTAAAMVMILLVAACANLGTLVLARGVAREREIRTRMAGLTVFDPLAYLAAMAFFAAVMGLAVFAPARRAIRIDPSSALQHE